ncbi:TPA: hypothetical protein ACYFWG_005400, partial [Klebsiella pneumoniae]
RGKLAETQRLLTFREAFKIVFICFIHTHFFPLRPGSRTLNLLRLILLSSHPVFRMPPAATSWASCLDDLLRWND